ncbi:MAG TPA: hypothetical protein VGL77_14260, partial [Armatimonadota bacterium]
MTTRIIPALLIVLLVLSGMAWGQAAPFAGWTAPAIGKLDPTGGRTGKAALCVATAIETTNQPWVSPPYAVRGKYLRASAWMKTRDLYYRDFGFYAYGAVEFFDAAGKSLAEQTFISSRELMLAEPVVYQRMMLHDRLLSLDWRYSEHTVAVPAGAATARVKFGFPFRCIGQAWLDDVTVTFSEQTPPAENQSTTAAKVPATEIRLRSPKYHLDIDPLSPIFYPNEDAVFCVAVPAAAKNATAPVVRGTVT